MKDALRGSVLEVSRRTESVKPRTVNHLVNMGVGQEFGVHNADINTLERGLLERVFFTKGSDGQYNPPIQPAKGVYNKRLSTFKRRLCRGWPSTNPISYDEFLSYYRARKLTVYTNAVESLMNSPVQKKDSYLSTFVKAEKINFTAKPDPAPRVIQPRNPRFNVEVGVYLKPIEHKLYHRIGKIFGSPVVVKGMNAQQRGRLISSKWRRFAKPVAVGLDAKRFDQHTSLQALRWEHSVYLTIYKNDPPLARLLNWQLHNRGFARCSDGVAKYRTVGSRMSGDMNTALGNVLIMCALMWTYMETLGIHYEFVNDGDDCILMVESKDEHRLATLVPWFAEMGYVMEREPSVTVLERINFCQSQPVFDGIEYRMVRDPRIACGKDLISFKSCRTNKQWDAARLAIAECGAALAGDMPICGSFYRMLGQGAVGKLDWGNDLPGMYFLAMGMEQKFSRPTSDCRYSFYLAFGVTPDEQVALEEQYENTRVEWREGPLDVEQFNHVDSMQVLFN